MIKEEVRKKIYGFLKYTENEKSALKITYQGGKIYLAKGLWPEYIEEIIWANDSRVWKLMERQCIFRLQEFQALYKHPVESCGCAFIITQPWDLRVYEIPDLAGYSEAEILDCLPESEIEVSRITRYEVMQDIKNKKWN